MGFITFIKRSFILSGEQFPEVEERRKRLILRVMAGYREKDNRGLMTFQNIHREFHRREMLPPEDFLKLLQGNVSDGFVQRLDGGNKELSPVQACYIISSNGLNHIGLPGY